MIIAEDPFRTSVTPGKGESTLANALLLINASKMIRFMARRVGERSRRGKL
jgi:hypothetical protein